MSMSSSTNWFPKVAPVQLALGLSAAHAKSISSWLAKDIWHIQSTKEKLLHKATPSNTKRKSKLREKEIYSK